MTAFSAFAWFARNPIMSRSEQPPRAAVRIMLEEIAAKMKVTGFEPVRVSCVVWPPSAFSKRYGNDWLARISILAAPSDEIGEPRRSLLSWFEWQHPRWVIAGAVPQIERAPSPEHPASIRSATLEVRA